MRRLMIVARYIRYAPHLVPIPTERVQYVQYVLYHHLPDRASAPSHTAGLISGESQAQAKGQIIPRYRSALQNNFTALTYHLQNYQTPSLSGTCRNGRRNFDFLLLQNFPQVKRSLQAPSNESRRSDVSERIDPRLLLIDAWVCAPHQRIKG